MSQSLPIRRTLAAAAMLAAFGLAACSGNREGEPAPLDEGNAAVDLPLETNFAEPAAMTPDNAIANQAMVAEDKSGSPSEQVFEDADASGMTARLPPPADDPAPATEQGEERK